MSGAASARPAVLVCACVAPFGWLVFWALFHTVPGQDWVVFHTAAARFWAHDLAMLSDPRAFTAELNRSHAAWFAQPLTFHPWVYPPVTLLLALAFGWLGYPASLGAFLAVSGGMLVAASWPWAAGWRARLWLVAGVFASPAAAFNIGAGQLGFLVAACVLAGMALLERRPFLAGLAFSVLCLKPQFVPLIPVALLAGRHWRAITGGLVGGVGLVAASAVVVGVPAWGAWVGLATGRDRQLAPLIDAMRIYDQSVHTCLHWLGAGEGLAGAGQVAAFVAAAACVLVVFARPGASARQRVVVLLCAMVVGAPHVGNYDYVLAAAAALLAGRFGWLAAAVWVAPVLEPPALVAVLGVPGLSVVSALLVLLPAWLMVRMTGQQAWGSAPDPAGA